MFTAQVQSVRLERERLICRSALTSLYRTSAHCSADRHQNCMYSTKKGCWPVYFMSATLVFRISQTRDSRKKWTLLLKVIFFQCQLQVCGFTHLFSPTPAVVTFETFSAIYICNFATCMNNSGHFRTCIL